MTNKTTNEFAPDVRSRAVRMVFEHEGDHASRWAAIASIAAEIGCPPETLRLWVKRAERESGRVDGAAPDLNARLKSLERENRELRQANEILRKGETMPAIGPRAWSNAYFAPAELDRRQK